MFNSLRYTKKLEEVGFTRIQAEISIEILMEIMQENLVTKHDLLDLKNEMNLKFIDVIHKLEKLESKMTIKLGAMLVTAIALMTAIQKLS